MEKRMRVTEVEGGNHDNLCRKKGNFTEFGIGNEKNTEQK
jgi:hypothetical protein